MKFKLLIIVALALLLSVFVVRAERPQQEQTLTLDQIARSIVFLQSPPRPKPGTNQKESEIGTGFLVNLNGYLFLTTASHVATLMTATSSVTFGTQNDIARTVPLGELTSTAGEPKWIVNPTADVAVLYLEPKPEITALLTPRALLPFLFLSKLEAPARTRPLTVVGFPLGLGVIFTGPDTKISPISREAKAASGLITLPRFDTKKPSEFFLLDSPTVGGFSGAPVFILPGSFSDGAGITFSGSTFCVGLIHGTISDDTGGKLAAVVPSAFITQTLETAYATARQKK